MYFFFNDYNYIFKLYTYYVLHILNYFIKVFFDTKLNINKLVTNHQQIAMFLFFISDYWTTVL